MTVELTHDTEGLLALCTGVGPIHSVCGLVVCIQFGL